MHKYVSSTTGLDIFKVFPLRSLTGHGWNFFYLRTSINDDNLFKLVLVRWVALGSSTKETIVLRWKNVTTRCGAVLPKTEKFHSRDRRCGANYLVSESSIHLSLHILQCPWSLIALWVGRHVITRIHLLPMLIKVSGSFVLHMPMTVPDYTLPACLSTNSVQFLMESKSCRPFNTQEVPLHFSLSCNLKGEIMLSKLNNKLWLAVSVLIQERNGYPPGPGSLWINLWLTKKFCDCWLSPWMIFRIFQGCH